MNRKIISAVRFLCLGSLFSPLSYFPRSPLCRKSINVPLDFVSAFTDRPESTLKSRIFPNYHSFPRHRIVGLMKNANQINAFLMANPLELARRPGKFSYTCSLRLRMKRVSSIFTSCVWSMGSRSLFPRINLCTVGEMGHISPTIRIRRGWGKVRRGICKWIDKQNRSWRLLFRFAEERFNDCVSVKDMSFLTPPRRRQPLGIDRATDLFAKSYAQRPPRPTINEPTVEETVNFGCSAGRPLVESSPDRDDMSIELPLTKWEFDLIN